MEYRKINFKMSELIHSDVAALYKINNYPDIYSLDNMMYLIVFCLQPVRDLLQKPMIITSGYRCPALNKKVGGSNTSDHLRGMAADFVVNGMSPYQICMKIKNSDLKFTQLIEEYSDGQKWVHISFNPQNLKRETLVYSNGTYKKI